jgi:hypothetical protein
MTRHDVPGTTYLLHLDPPLRHARHYLGFAEGDERDLEDRLADHGGPHGAKILAAQLAAGGTWHLTRTWPGTTRADERRIKNTAHVPHYCPDCQPQRSAARRTARQIATGKDTTAAMPTNTPEPELNADDLFWAEPPPCPQDCPGAPGQCGHADPAALARDQIIRETDSACDQPTAGTDRLAQLAAAGDRYDAAVRHVWAGIPADLGTRAAWKQARAGMVAAQRQLDADLDAIRAGHNLPELDPPPAGERQPDGTTAREDTTMTTADPGDSYDAAIEEDDERNHLKMCVAEGREPIAAMTVGPARRTPPMTSTDDAAIAEAWAQHELNERTARRRQPAAGRMAAARQQLDRDLTAARAGADDAARTVSGMYAGGIGLEAIAAHHDDVSTQLLNEAQTGYGRAYAREYSETAASLVADLRQDEAVAQGRSAAACTQPQGTPHPDPVLAARGWQVDHGIYQRTGQALADREAG